MKLNVGNLESFIRIFVGVIVLYSAIYGYIAGALGFVGAIFILTGLSRYCPLKALFGCNSCGSCEEEEQH